MRSASTAPACSRTAPGVLTHCNAGALATGGYGTALGVIRTAHRRDPSLTSGWTRPDRCSRARG